MEIIIGAFSVICLRMFWLHQSIKFKYGFKTTDGGSALFKSYSNGLNIKIYFDEKPNFLRDKFIYWNKYNLYATSNHPSFFHRFKGFFATIEVDDLHKF